MRFIRAQYPCLIILAAYALCVLAANPSGEFPLNDDWSYARSAFAFGSGHGFKVDEWAAPSLLGQVFYGGLLTRFFSPSFLVLRLSTLVLSGCTALLLWGIFRRMPIRRDLACILLLAWIFNPLQFSLSFTFLTEIPFLFFVALATYWFVRYLHKPASGFLMLSAAALGYAFTIRQTALFFFLALLGGVLADARTRFLQRVRRILLPAVAFGIFVAGYFLWVETRGGSTAAIDRKYDLLHHIQRKQLIGNTYGMLFYLVFMSLPVWLLLIPSFYRRLRDFRGKARIGILAAWILLVAAGLCWFPRIYGHAEFLPATPYHSRMPYLINVLYDTGLGPITLDPDYFRPVPTPAYPGVWIAVTALVAAGALLCGASGTIGLIRLRKFPLPLEQRPLCVFAGLVLLSLIPFEIVFSNLQEGGLFDRHVLIVALPFYLLLGLFSLGETEKAAARAPGIPAVLTSGIAVLAFGVFCVAATHDYLEWNRIRWEMGRGLLARGIDPLSIAGGFEFDAWHNYDTFLARGNIAKVKNWWYDARDYGISMIRQADCRVLETREYFSWVHRRKIPLYLLGK